MSIVCANAVKLFVTIRFDFVENRSFGAKLCSLEMNPDEQQPVQSTSAGPAPKKKRSNGWRPNWNRNAQPKRAPVHSITLPGVGNRDAGNGNSDDSDQEVSSGGNLSIDAPAVLPMAIRIGQTAGPYAAWKIYFPQEGMKWISQLMSVSLYLSHSFFRHLP